MDDLSFRHRATATPNDKSEEFLKRMMDSEQDKALVNKAKDFDAQLQCLLKVNVPEDLNDKIFLKQSFAIENERKRVGRWHVAIAASIAFIIGISLPLLNNIAPSSLNIGEVAMQHVQAEYYFTAQTNEHADLKMVNAKLARYGAQAHDPLGEVSYINYCDFEGTPALHMVMQGKKGQVTVFIVPNDANFILTDKFNNQHLKGITAKMGETNVVIVGDRDESLGTVLTTMKKNIVWNAKKAV